MLAEFCMFYNEELPLKILHDRTPAEMIGNWLHHHCPDSVQSCPPSNVPIIPNQEGPDSHHLSEEEELFRLRDKNRRLRLEQELLNKRRANSFGKDEKSHDAHE